MSHFSSKRLLQAQRVKLNNVKNKPALVSSTGKGRVNFRLINRRVYKPKQAVASAVVALIQSWNLFDTLLPTIDDTEFGKSIAMSEDGTFIAVIAQDTPSQPGTTSGKGSLHIFKLNNY